MNIKATFFGEVLIDQFENYSKVGGAPLNGALRLHSFGVDVNLISAIGEDDNGETILSFINRLKLNTSNIQKKENLPTGLVNIELNEKGNAEYEIVYPSAWDNISLSDENFKAVKESDFIVFGSLASRSKESKSTLINLLSYSKFKVFDVNLRAPHYNLKTLSDLMLKSDMIKMNDEELYEISKNLGSKYNSFKQNILFLSQKTKTNIICVTKGAFGAVLYIDGEFYNNNGYKVKVIDTVGSGDSFLASLLFKMMSGEKPQKAIDYACAIGAMVAQSEGANPSINQEEIEQFMFPVETKLKSNNN